MSEDAHDEQAAIKRERSPSFPYLDLETALDLSQKLYAQAKMNDVRIPDLADAWGMTPKSGSLLRYVSALAQYGLVEARGSGNERRFRLSAEARRIMEDDRPGVREELLSEAALRPKVIRGLYFGEDDMPKWGSERPSDGIAESALKFDLNFTSDAARRLLNVYDATIRYAVVSGDDSEPVDNDLQSELESEAEKSPEADMEPNESVAVAPSPTPAPAELNKIDFQSDGPGVILINAKLDVEGLEMLEKKIAAFKVLLN